MVSGRVLRVRVPRRLHHVGALALVALSACGATAEHLEAPREASQHMLVSSPLSRGVVKCYECGQKSSLSQHGCLDT